jgi:hypothetical protein
MLGGTAIDHSGRISSRWKRRDAAHERERQHSSMSAQELFPFRFRDPATGKWVRARHRAPLDEIRDGYAEWELVGAPEIRSAGGGMFNPHGRSLPRSSDPALELALDPYLPGSPAIDAAEAALVRLFLRRYVTWCARQRKFAQMNGAVRLHARLVPLA